MLRYGCFKIFVTTIQNTYILCTNGRQIDRCVNLARWQQFRISLLELLALKLSWNFCICICLLSLFSQAVLGACVAPDDVSRLALSISPPPSFICPALLIWLCWHNFSLNDDEVQEVFLFLRSYYFFFIAFVHNRILYTFICRFVGMLFRFSNKSFCIFQRILNVIKWHLSYAIILIVVYHPCSCIC